MGFVGMIIGVPTFAVMYRLVTEFTTWRLGKKALSGNLNEYDRLNYIDETEQTYIKNRGFYEKMEYDPVDSWNSGDRPDINPGDLNL